MTFPEIEINRPVSCSIRTTFLELFVYNSRSKEYKKFYSVQKRDWDGVIGGAIKERKTETYIPICLTDEFKSWLSKRVEVPATTILRGQVGALELEEEDDSYNGNFVTGDEALEIDRENGAIIDTLVPEVERIPKPQVAVVVPDVLYARATAVEYNYLSENEFEIIEEEDNGYDDYSDYDDSYNREEKQDISKLIWIALGAAALLL